MINEEIKQWATEVFNKIDGKLTLQAERLGDKIPYIVDEERGLYEEDKGITEPVWWCNGFWSGMMWQMYHATGNDLYRQTAEANETRLDKAFDIYTGLHHDVGFMWLHTAVANYRLETNARKPGVCMPLTCWQAVTTREDSLSGLGIGIAQVG